MENVTDFVKPLHLRSVSGFVEYPCYEICNTTTHNNSAPFLIKMFSVGRYMFGNSHVFSCCGSAVCRLNYKDGKISTIFRKIRLLTAY